MFSDALLQKSPKISFQSVLKRQSDQRTVKEESDVRFKQFRLLTLQEESSEDENNDYCEVCGNVGDLVAHNTIPHWV